MILLDKFPTHIAYTNNVGRNKYIKVNNQNVYNGKLNRFARSIAVDNLHKWVATKISCKPIKKYPVKIHYIFNVVYNHGAISKRSDNIIWKPHKPGYKANWDLDNLFTLWMKVINDTLVEKSILKDDTVDYLNGVIVDIKFVKDLEDRSILIKFIS